MSAPPLILMQGISKRYGELWANRQVTLAVAAGEIHALVGENGAGKSTLMKILFGLVQPDEGNIHLDGKPVAFKHPKEALRAGIGMVQQQLLIFPQLTSLENIVVGAEVRRWGVLNRKETRRKVEALCCSFGFDLPLDVRADEISFAHRQQMELLRLLYRGARILLLDEPSSLLAPAEIERLLALLRTFRAEGHTIILTTHRLREVFAIADRITILRRGELAGTWQRDQTSAQQIASLLVPAGDDAAVPNGDGINYLSPGRIAGSLFENASSPSSRPRPESMKDQECWITAPAADFDPEFVDMTGNGGEAMLGQPSSELPPEAPPILSVETVTAQSVHQEPGITDFCLQLREGEIFGMAGVVGNGQRVLALLLAGMHRVSAGTIRLGAHDITNTPAAARLGMGIRWLPENSLEEGALAELSLWENLLLGFQRRPSNQTLGWLHKKRIMQKAESRLELSRVAYTNITQPLSDLSGGNQQKVILERALTDPLKMVLLEQPCRGLDIHAQRETHRRIRSLIRAGVTFLIFSYDLEELLSLSHRIGVMYRGRLMGVTHTHRAERELLGQWMLGAPE